MRALLVLLLAAAAAPAPAQHAGHAPPPAEPDPHAQHRAEQAEDPHAGHEMGEPQDPHAGHAPAAPAAAPPAGPPPPGAFSGPEHAADAVFGAAAMAAAREALRATHGAMPAHRLGVDQLEIALRGGRDAIAWEDLHFWYGGDIDRLWLKSSGEAVFGEGLERAELQALWSRAIGPFFDLQAGARLDFGRGPERAHLVLGVQGLAPYRFEVDAALFLSTRGDLTARFEGEYDQRITQRLILQPRIELDLSLQDVPELGIGSGLSSAEAGLRLRYEIVPEFAPYVGIGYERAFGDAAGFARAAGEEAGGWSLLLGVRAWF